MLNIITNGNPSRDGIRQDVEPLFERHFTS